MKNETIYFILAIIGIILSILFCITTVVYMIIANDLTRISRDQQSYISELEWEIEQTEMICSNIEEP
jgi:hypothetical protein